jgi:hypothetical protein
VAISRDLDSRTRERLTDPPTDSGDRRVAIGCGITALTILLTAGVLGLGIGVWNRFVSPMRTQAGPREASGDSEQTGDADHDGSASDESSSPPNRVEDPLASMRRRYIPGPHVRIEGMIPSSQRFDRAATPSGFHSGNTDGSPWIVYGARFESGAAPAPTSQPAPRIEHDRGEDLSHPLSVLSGVPVEAEVLAADASGGSGVTAYAVAFIGYEGYFVLPAMVPTELGPVSAGGSNGATIRFTLGAPIRPRGAAGPSGQEFPVVMRMAAIDDQGRVSPWITRNLQVLPVGTGDVEVALTMTAPTDLDLYVTDPLGATVYFGNTTSMSGGHLDLDANAACSSNLGVNNEHVYWGQGRAPRGTYSVRVAHYESCIQGRPVDYRITVRNCGETVVLSGRFVGAGESTSCLSGGNSPNFCQDVVSFVVPSCAPPNR